MAFTLGPFIIDGIQLQRGPDTDSDWHAPIKMAELDPIGASESIEQLFGFKSAERTIEGYFSSDADYQAVYAKYRLQAPVPCTDWTGGAFVAVITDLKPSFVGDVLTAFETRRYTLTFKRRPG